MIKFFSRIMMPFTLLAFISCSISNSQNNFKEGDKITVQILQTSDIHNRFRAYEYPNSSITKGGLTRVSSLISNLRKEYPTTLLIDTGDTIEDNFSDIFLMDKETIKVNPTLLSLNYLNYDIWVPGNHEFNYGVPVLQEFSTHLKAKTILANVYKEGERLYDPYTIIETPQGIKIGVIGVVTPHITKWDKDNLLGYDVTNPNEELVALVEELEPLVDLMVLAAHISPLGEYGHDSGFELTQQFPQFSLILTGHAHDNVNERFNDTIVIEPAKYAEALSRILITFEKDAFNNWVILNPLENIKTEVLLTSSYEEDPKLVSLTQKAHDKAVTYGAEVIGILEGGSLAPKDEIEGIPQSLLEPTALIGVVLETMNYYSGADISATALFMGNANVEEGKIQVSDLSSIYKYSNELRVYQMTGEQLKRYMEWSASFFNTFNQEEDIAPSFNPDFRLFNYDMFSNISYDIDISQPAGKRIYNLKWLKNNKSIQNNDILTMAVSDYRGKTILEEGMYDIFTPGEIRSIDLDNVSQGLRELVGRYIKEVKKGVIKAEVSPELLNFKITGYALDEETKDLISKLSKEGKLKAKASDNGRNVNVVPLTKEDLKNM